MFTAFYNFVYKFVQNVIYKVMWAQACAANGGSHTFKFLDWVDISYNIYYTQRAWAPVIANIAVIALYIAILVIGVKFAIWLYESDEEDAEQAAIEE